MAQIVRPNFRRRQRRRARRYQRRSWPRNYYIREGLLVLVAFVVLCAAYYVKENWDRTEHPVSGLDEIEVIDGDTVRSGGRRYRLVAFNTPETGWRAKCSEERALASKATARLEQLVTKGGVDLQRVACACPAAESGCRCRATWP